MIDPEGKNKILESYLNINSELTNWALEHADFDDTSIYHWGIRSNIPNFLQRFIFSGNKLHGLKKLKYIVRLPFIALFFILRPALLGLLWAIITTSLATTFIWFVLNYTHIYVFFSLWFLFSVRLIHLVFSLVFYWYMAVLRGIPEKLNAPNIRDITKWSRRGVVWATLYLVLICFLFYSGAFLSEKKISLSNLLLFNLDIIANSISFNFIKSTFGSFSDIQQNTLLESFVFSLLKFSILAGLVTSIVGIVDRINNASSDFIGTKRELVEYVVGMYRLNLQHINVIPAQKLETNEGLSLPIWVYALACSTSPNFKEYKGWVGRDFQLRINKIVQLGLKIGLDPDPNSKGYITKKSSGGKKTPR